MKYLLKTFVLSSKYFFFLDFGLKKNPSRSRNHSQFSRQLSFPFVTSYYDGSEHNTVHVMYTLFSHIVCDQTVSALLLTFKWKWTCLC